MSRDAYSLQSGSACEAKFPYGRDGRRNSNGSEDSASIEGLLRNLLDPVRNVDDFCADRNPVYRATQLTLSCLHHPTTSYTLIYKLTHLLTFAVTTQLLTYCISYKTTLHYIREQSFFLFAILLSILFSIIASNNT